MATTKNQYTGDGSTVLFPFTFPYIEESDVVVSIDGVVQTITTQYVFSNATTIGINTAPATGAVVLISRQTSAEDLKATFFPGSAIRARDLNDNFTQNLYTTQEAEASSIEATTAATNAATSAANAASDAATAAAGVATAQAAATSASTSATNAASDAATALTSANNAVSTANTASTDATNAVNTANTASTNINTAVNTANSAATDAATAITTANSATTTANSAVTTANSAATTANSAVTTANSAVTTANTADTNASSAVTTANTASTNATNAVNTANAASNAVSAAAFYTPVAALANLPGSPSNEDRVEVVNSTGVESNSSVSGVPTGFVGSTDLTIRLQYNSTTSKWAWQQYFAADPENRYLTAANAISSIITQTDFAYKPSSNTATLAGPSVSTNPSGLNEYRIQANTGGGYSTIRFEKSTNSTFYNLVNQLSQGDSIDLLWNNAGTESLDTMVFTSLSDNTLSGVTYGEIIVYSVLGTIGLGNYPMAITSTQIVNGVDPIYDNEVLRYSTATNKWTVSDPQDRIITLTDFSLKPSSNQLTLSGPNVTSLSAANVTDQHYELIKSGQELYINWRATNTTANACFDTMVNGNAMSVGYYYNANGTPTYTEITGTFNGFQDNTGSSPLEKWLRVAFTYNTFGTPLTGSYPLVIKSSFLINGFDAIANDQVLRYKTATQKWTVDDAETIAICDGGNFDNGSSLATTTSTFDGGSF